MSGTLWKLFCVDEANVVYKWGVTEPTVCPNNQYHTIEPSSVREDERYFDKVKAAEESTGYFETTQVEMEIPSGTPGTISEHDVTWPYDILLWRTLITPTTDMIGDTITVMAAPETLIGVLTNTGNISDTILTVSSSVIANMYRGFGITIDDGVNKQFLDRCTNIDVANSQITVETALAYTYAPNTPIKISVYVLRDIYISNTLTLDIGLKGFKGKTITANMILRVYYTNNSGTTKTIRWRPEYYNMG